MSINSKNCSARITSSQISSLKMQDVFGCPVFWEICQLVLKDRFYPLKVSPTAGGFFVI